VLVGSVGGLGPVAGGGGTIYETETAYQQLRVGDSGDVRTLYLDGVRHSAMFKNDPDRYVFEYTRYFHLPFLLRDDVDRVLFVGGGGFSGPERFLAEYPDVTVDVVELDPEVVRVARAHFGVSESERLNVYTTDGREFLERTDRTYDVIVLDAYRKDRVPYHLTTAEFMALTADRLDEDGVVVANVISAASGPGSQFYRAEYKTMRTAFPNVYAFPTVGAPVGQNVELLATKRSGGFSRADPAALIERPTSSPPLPDPPC
jgi:spermidine synthase